ncbi:MAG: hypothetical protein JWN43_1099 [Gammaproteobacteria bacterium]|nr:hypothetical protein [Gammaproteobacteria bacterium]
MTISRVLLIAVAILITLGEVLFFAGATAGVH